jgi:hypothetical protein
MPTSNFTTFPLFSEDSGPPSKRCGRCRQLLPLTEFHRCVTKRDGHQIYCKLCISRCQKEKYSSKLTTNPLLSEDFGSSTKLCTKCHGIKLLTEFSKSRNSRLGVRGICKECIKEINRSYRECKKADPEFIDCAREKRRNHHIMAKYGISKEEYERMFEEQDGLCAICRRAPGEKGILHIDHCHKSKRLRGLLCGHCNRALGIFGDNIESLKNAIAYLERFRD